MSVEGLGYTPGTGADVAVETIGGFKYQLVKFTFGIVGAASPVSSSDPLPVVQTGTPELPPDAATETTLSSIGALLAGGIPVTGTFWPVTQPVSGTVAISGSVAVTGTFWQATQPVSGTFWQATQPVSAASLPLPTGASTETTLGTRLSESDFDTKIGSLTEAAPASDTASSGLNGRLQRLAQRITSLIALVPAALSALGNFKISFADLAGTAPDTNSGNKSAGTLRVVLATDQPALTNKLLVTPDANSAVNVAQMNGVAVTMGTGNSGTGVQRVVLATDQPQLTNKLLVTPDANSAVNVAQMNGVAVSMGSGASGTGVQRVILATNDPVVVQLTAGATAIAKAEDVATAGGDVGVPAMAVQTATPADTAADNDYVFLQMKGGRQWVSGPGAVTCTVNFTRPNDTTAYAANDQVSDSTSAPTVFTLTNAARLSGGTGIIKSVRVDYSTKPSTRPQLLLLVFDSAPASANDNAAEALSDSDRRKLIPGGVIPITCNQDFANGCYGQATGLDIVFTTSGSANLRLLLMAANAFTPAAQDVIDIRFGIEYRD